MKIKTFISLLDDTPIATAIKPPAKRGSFLSDEQVNIDKKYKVSGSFKIFQSNLINILKNFISKNENLFEGRNDIKLILLTSILRTPKNFELLKITIKTKEKLIRYLISKKTSIKLKKEESAFVLCVNSAIDQLFKKDILERLVSGDLRSTFYNISNAIKENLINRAGCLDKVKERMIKINVEKRIAEAISIKMIAPNTSTKPKIEGGSYYSVHPNGAGHFPDFVFYFGKNPNEDALAIKKYFKIQTPKVFIESKASARKVGKQTTPEKFKRTLNDDNLFTKLTSVHTKQKSLAFNGAEVKKILMALDIDLSIPIIYLNITGKTRRTRIKSLNTEIGNSDIFRIERATPGQIKISKKGKNIFGFEIGSVAYRKGLFKEEVVQYVQA